MCQKCCVFTGSTEINEELTIHGDAIEKVKKFLYLGGVLSSGKEVQKAVTARIRSERKKFNYHNKGIPKEVAAQPSDCSRV